jgi:hypothetical protein
VLENVRVLLGLVTTRPSHAGDDAAESMLAVIRLGATANHQGAIDDRPGVIVDRPGATDDHPGVVTNRKGATANHQGAAIDCPGAADIAAPKPKKLSL